MFTSAPFLQSFSRQRKCRCVGFRAYHKTHLPSLSTAETNHQLSINRVHVESRIEIRGGKLTELTFALQPKTAKPLLYQ